MFERRDEKLLPRNKFLIRVAKYLMLSLLLIVASLIAGITGYMALEGLGFVDAFLNSAMIMGGMGPVNMLHNDSAKVFAGFYALWCGYVELVAVGIFAAPIAHRILHSFHLEGRST